MLIGNKRSLCKKSCDLQLHPRENDGIRIFDLRGRLILGNSEAILRRSIAALAETGAVKIVLNLAGVTEIDDAGLGALVFCHALLLNSGGAMKLLHLSPLHLDPTVVAKLGTVFEVFREEHEAINSFFPRRAVRRYDILDWVQEQTFDRRQV